MDDVRVAALIAVVAIAPLAIIIVIALLRGYTIFVHLHRGQKNDKDDSRG
jgi:hypothetical protein